MPGEKLAYPGNMRTRDHIVPQCWGRVCGSSNFRVTRRCCRACNELRARLGHCAGLLWIACGEAKRTRQTPGQVAEYMLRWGRAAVFGGRAV